MANFHYFYSEFYWQLLASGGQERHLTIILVKGAGMSAEDINGRALFICRVSRPHVSSGSMSELYDPPCCHAVLYQAINGDSQDTLWSGFLLVRLGAVQSRLTNLVELLRTNTRVRVLRMA